MINKEKQRREAGFAFDLDGTLIDTEEHKAVSHQQTIEHFGGTATEDLYYQYIGNSFGFVFQQLKKRTHIHADLKEYQEVFNRFYLDQLHGTLKPGKGAIRLLERIRERGFGIALVTSSQRWMMELIAEKSGMKKYFTIMVSGDDVEHNKPAPDPYLLAIASLNAEAVFAFEDTKPGVTSAREAGAIVFGMKNDHNSPEDFSQAEKTYNDFDEVDLDGILSRYQHP